MQGINIRLLHQNHFIDVGLALRDLLLKVMLNLRHYIL